MSDKASPLPEDAAALVPGLRYRVSFDDCCVSGHFDGVFERVTWRPNCRGDPPNRPLDLIFDTGQVGVHDNWKAKGL